MVVKLGQFTQKAMEERVGSDIAAGIRAAVKHYRRRLESGRKPLDLPAYFRLQPPLESITSIEVALGADAEEAVNREAIRQRVSPEEILSHAILTYLADMDSHGRPLAFVDPPTV